MRIQWICLILSCFIFCETGRAAPAISEEPKLFEGILEEFGASFSGTNLFYHLGGIAATPLVARSGLDAEIHDAVKHDPNTFMVPGAILGSGLVAAAVAYPLYQRGKVRGDSETVGAAFVMVDATLIALTTATVLKFFTGRTPPDIHSVKSTQELSEEFNFGIGRRGVFEGWPSGHVIHTVAVTSALAHYYPDRAWLKWTSVGLSSYVVLTVSTFRSGQMHWFSDAVAGGLMGYAIGSTVGKKSRARLDGKKVNSVPDTLSWQPVLAPDYKGVSFSLAF